MTLNSQERSNVISTLIRYFESREAEISQVELLKLSVELMEHVAYEVSGRSAEAAGEIIALARAADQVAERLIDTPAKDDSGAGIHRFGA
ncbi:MAG: hypothetical protein AAFR50_07840 [Pseudomonadota bacterium]